VREREWFAAQEEQRAHHAEEREREQTQARLAPPEKERKAAQAGPTGSPDSIKAIKGSRRAWVRPLTLGVAILVVLGAAVGGVTAYVLSDEGGPGTATSNPSPDRDGDGLPNEADRAPDESAGQSSEDDASDSTATTTERSTGDEDNIVGTWTGEATYEDGDTSDVTLTIEELFEGERAGTLRSGSCGGDLTFQGRPSSNFLFDQVETENVEGCVDETDVALSLGEGDEIEYYESWENSSGDTTELRGTLSREGCGPDDPSEC